MNTYIARRTAILFTFMSLFVVASIFPSVSLAAGKNHTGTKASPTATSTVATASGKLTVAKKTAVSVAGTPTPAPTSSFTAVVTQSAPLPPDGYQTFDGLISTASSTIGDGTQTGGLTISGGATTTSTVNFAGTITTPASVLLSGVNVSDIPGPGGYAGGSMYGIEDNEIFVPTGTPGYVFGEYLRPILANYSNTGSTSIASFAAENAQPTLESSFTGNLQNIFDYEGGDVYNLSGFVVPQFYQFFTDTTNNGNGETTGTVTNRNYSAGGSSAGAGANGTISNSSYFGDVPTGSGAGTTNNYGLFIHGNGGASAAGTHNYAIYSDSTAVSYLGGKLNLGSATVGSGLTVWGPDIASTTAFSVLNASSTPTFTVYDNGNVTYSASIYQYSDSRLKTSVTPLNASSSLAAILALNPVSYTRIDQPSQPTNFGFIAQAVQNIFPNLVAAAPATKLTPGGTLTLNYIGLIAPIVNSIQALSAQINAFSQDLTTSIVHTQEMCVGTTCINQAQLKAMLKATGQTATPDSD